MIGKNNRLLKVFTAVALLIALMAGMATSMGKKADAAGGWTVTFTFYNGQTKETRRNVPNGSYISLTVPRPTANATFLGWKCGSTIYPTNKTVKISGNMNFVGVWQVLVNFYDYNGRQIDQRSEKTGYTYILPSNTPKRAGYVFDGWYASSGEKIDGTTCVKAFKHDVTARYRKYTPDEAADIIDPILYGVNVPAGIAANQKDYPWTKNSTTCGGGYIFQHVNEKGGDAGGMCTPCAIANLLNRRLVLDTGSAANRFDFINEVVRELYGVKKKNSKGNYVTSITVSIRSKNGYWCSFKDSSGTLISPSGYCQVRTFTNAAGRQYSTCQDDSIASLSSVEDRAAKLVELLKEHPEGIVLYSCKHAMVLTNYSANSKIPGGYDFCAIDTGGSLGGTSYDFCSKTPITKAYGYTDDHHANKSMERLLAKTDYVIYVK